MKKYLILGLTSSCTKIVARMIAMNLGIIDDIEQWDGRNDIENNKFFVSHRSLPHFHRSMPDRWIDDSFARGYDDIILVTRDINCSMIASIRDHQPSVQLAKKENEQGIKIIKEIIDARPDLSIFSYETAYILQDHYTIPFLNNLGIKNAQHVYFKNVNKKYIGENYD